MGSKTKTLCEWEKEKIKADFDKLAGIVSAPKFACKNCARAARKKKYLCEPKRIEAN